MKVGKLLESYIDRKDLNSDLLDGVATDFKKLLIDYINEEYLSKKIQSDSTRNRVSKNIDGLIKQEHNSIKVPYYHILENINLCIEVEMSHKVVNEEKTETFGKYKFSQILESGFNERGLINRFEIDELVFLNDLKNLVSKFTREFEISEESIIIQFN